MPTGILALLLQIHDELVVEMPENEVETVEAVLVDTMESAMQLRVPLVVESAVGSTWFDAK